MWDIQQSYIFKAFKFDFFFVSNLERKSEREKSLEHTSFIKQYINSRRFNYTGIKVVNFSNEIYIANINKFKFITCKYRNKAILDCFDL